jgi:hypothetical protein
MAGSLLLGGFCAAGGVAVTFPDGPPEVLINNSLPPVSSIRRYGELPLPENRNNQGKEGVMSKSPVSKAITPEASVSEEKPKGTPTSSGGSSTQAEVVVVDPNGSRGDDDH